MKTINKMKKVILLILFLMFASNFALAQAESGRVAFGFNAGAVKYWGEFTDNQFWFAGDLFVRYNIFPYVSIMGTVGMASIKYKTDQTQIDRYPGYFGTNGKYLYSDGTESDISIDSKNNIRVNTYELYACFNIFPHEKFVPYVFGGVGMMNWEPKTGDVGQGVSLPNNAQAVYSKSQMVIPLGLGFEMYISDNVVLNGRGTYRITGTDYLDDYAAAGGAPEDAFLTFGVGLSYYVFGDADYDNDGLTNDRERALGTDPRNPDTDGDKLMDGEEVDIYYSKPLKPDSDDDGLNDYDEVTKYHSNPVNPDTDGDGLIDGQEIVRKTDISKTDTDDDGLIDGEEVNNYKTDPNNPDTDGDGLADGEEVNKYSTDPKSKDTDNDGLEDGAEVKQYKTNPKLMDSDSDGLSDGLEAKQYKTDPIIPDTDKDGLNDGDEINNYATDPLKTDSDGDGLNDGDEVKKYKTNPSLADTDSDGLNDGDEINKLKTDPLIADTDKDGLKDGEEISTYKTNPLDQDTDKDGLFDGDEVIKYHTNPLKSDTDSDKLTDGDEVNRVHSDPLNPDTDADKIIDGEDDCPLIAGVKSSTKGKNGCPAPPKVGTKTDFNDILFVVNTDQFNFEMPGTAMSLAKMLAYVKQCDDLRVLIEGHASAEGDDKRNQALSEMRAAKVKEWLISQGVSSDKITGTVGFGSSQQKIREPKGKALKKMSQADLENLRKQNRRITVKVVETCD